VGLHILFFDDSNFIIPLSLHSISNLKETLHSRYHVTTIYLKHFDFWS